jgi:Protein of unknown function (DUF3261)
MRVIVVILIVCLGGIACTTAREESAEFPSWQLPGPEREVVQILTGHYGETKFQLQVRISMTDDMMQMVGLDSLGRRAFDIKWDAQGLAASRAGWVSDELKAIDILKAVVVTYWPVESKIRTQMMGEKEKRLQIEYQTDLKNAWNETVILKDPEIDYEMTITSYEIEA